MAVRNIKSMFFVEALLVGSRSQAVRIITITGCESEGFGTDASS